ncbi:MAG: DMT family transporter [Sphaerochaeta sp.]|nr:DMT family transporter [Sphaerochaeta sp.]
MRLSEKQSDVLIGYALVALSAVCFGIMPIFASVAYASGEDTTTLLFLRFMIGGVFLAIIAKLKNAPLPPKSSYPVLFLLGALGYTGISFCYFTALNYASASLVSLLLYVYPALVTLFSVLFVHEKISSSKLIALMCAFGGCMLVLGLGGKGDLKGMALALGAAVIYAIYIIVSAQVIGKKTAMASSAFIILSASLSFACMVMVKGVHLPKTSEGLFATLAIALFSTVIAFWAFFSGLGRIGATNASLVSTLEPLVTVLSAMVFLGERLSLINLLGGVLILVGLVLSALPKPQRYA